MSLSQRPENTGFVGASCHSLQELRKAEQLASKQLTPVLRKTHIQTALQTTHCAEEQEIILAL
jgi:hypothetical protein